LLFIADFGIYLAGKDSLGVGAQYGDAAIRPDTVLDSHGTQCADLR
jgi:hypothetical protein